MQKTKEIIAEASKNGHGLKITGYRSSNGSVTDYELELIGKDGYQNLVKESLAYLTAGKIVQDGNLADVWSQALAEQAESWKKTLDGGHGRQYKEMEQGDGFSHDPEKPGVVVLRHLLCKNRTVREPGQESTTKSSPKTLAKRAIVQQTPIANYVGQLNLEEGKFETISIITK